jgi:hypothetical protein
MALLDIVTLTPCHRAITAASLIHSWHARAHHHITRSVLPLGRRRTGRPALLAVQDGRVQLVLLDHGLYRQMDDAFRVQYAGLWHALIFADVDAIRRHSTAMNAGHAVPLFAGMLTQRPWDEVRACLLGCCWLRADAVGWLGVQLA